MIYRITNLNGIFIRDDFTFDESIEIGLDVEPAQGLYQPKWNGTSWEEGATQEYIDSFKPQLSEPTEAERLEARVQVVETKTVTLEETLEVLFGG